MCYYSSITVGFKIIETRFGVRFIQNESFQPVYSASAFGFPTLPVITNEEPNQVSLLNWGLIPAWVKDAKTALHLRLHTLNARGETVFNKPAFRYCVVTRRCLVLVDGFYEWRHIGGTKYPYRIRLKDNEPFALAGIWDKWTDPDTGTEAKTFSVITTEANSLMAQIHNTRKRMPVILPREDEKQWIDGNLSMTKVRSMLKPYDEMEMIAYPVLQSIVKLGFNISHPEVISEARYDDLPPL
jgi:putative SOS response-associated peptidase YedK